MSHFSVTINSGKNDEKVYSSYFNFKMEDLNEKSNGEKGIKSVLQYDSLQNTQFRFQFSE